MIATASSGPYGARIRTLLAPWTTSRGVAPCC
jgi:hypothetical protein